MAEHKLIYRCQQCSYISPKWMGKCPECQTSIPGIWPGAGEAQVHIGQGMSDYYSRFPRRVSVN